MQPTSCGKSGSSFREHLATLASDSGLSRAVLAVGFSFSLAEQTIYLPLRVQPRLRGSELPRINSRPRCLTGHFKIGDGLCLDRKQIRHTKALAERR